MNSDFSVVVFAAGRGTRAGLAVPKVLAPVGDYPLIHYTLRAIAASSPARIVVVIGHEAALVRSAVNSTLQPLACKWSVVEQTPLLGTGHALATGYRHLMRENDSATQILCLNGDDSALLTPASISEVMEEHRCRQHQLSIVLTLVENEFVFGRARVSPPEVVEFLTYYDARRRSLLPLPVVTGIYAFERTWLGENIDRFSPDHRGELPIYELVYRARDAHARWGALNLHPALWASANTPQELAVLRQRLGQTQSRE